MRMLEIGVGAAADFENWCRCARHATEIDFTEAAVALTRERMELSNVPADRYHLQLGDVEDLSFEDDTFNLVYSC